MGKIRGQNRIMSICVGSSCCLLRTLRQGLEIFLTKRGVKRVKGKEIVVASGGFLSEVVN